MASTDATGATTTLAYDAVGNQIATTNARGFTTTVVYDALDRQEVVVDPLGGRTTLAYDAVGNVLSVTDANNHVTSFGYDALDRRVTTTDALNQTSTTVYDAVGNTVGLVDPLGFRTTIGYNARNEQVTVEVADNGVTTLAYDAVGNRVATTDPNGNTTTQVYDALNRVVNTTDAEGFTTTFAYDAVGRLTQQIDASGNTTSFVYDVRGLLTQETDALGQAFTFAYDAVGQRTSMTDRLGRRRDYDYDAVGRLEAENWFATGGSFLQTMTMAYDAVGNLLTVADPNGTMTFSYDALNRRTLEEGLFGQVLTNVYDAVGNRTVREDNHAGLETFTYDAVNRLTSQQSTRGGSEPVRIDYDYTARNQLETIRRYVDLTATTLVAQTDITHDAVGRETHRVVQDGSSATLSEVTLTYDLGGRLTEQVIDGTSTTFSYDDTDQITLAGTVVYDYDATGNRDSAGYSTTASNRMEASPTATYAYDTEGNRVGKTDTVSGDYWTYQYDTRNQLIQAEQRDSGNNLLYKVEYRYDAFGRRIEQVVNSTITTRFSYDGQDVLADLDGTNALVRRYIRTGEIDNLGAGVSSAGVVAFYLTDRQGTVLATVDSTGTLQNVLVYDVFGNLVSESNPDGDRYRYTGREWNASTGLQFNRWRYYDPATGKWTSEDPIRWSAGDVNLSRYVGNGPTNATDPLGMELVVRERQTAERIQQMLRGQTGGGQQEVFRGFNLNIQTKIIELPHSQRHILVPANSAEYEKIDDLVSKVEQEARALSGTLSNQAAFFNRPISPDDAERKIRFDQLTNLAMALRSLRYSNEHHMVDLTADGVLSRKSTSLSDEDRATINFTTGWNYYTLDPLNATKSIRGQALAISGMQATTPAEVRTRLRAIFQLQAAFFGTDPGASLKGLDAIEDGDLANHILFDGKLQRKEEVIFSLQLRMRELAKEAASFEKQAAFEARMRGTTQGKFLAPLTRNPGDEPQVRLRWLARAMQSVQESIALLEEQGEDTLELTGMIGINRGGSATDALTSVTIAGNNELVRKIAQNADEIENAKAMNRLFAVAQFAGGMLELAGAAALAVVPEPTPATKIASGYAFSRAVSDLWTAPQNFWDGGSRTAPDIAAVEWTLEQAGASKTVQQVAGFAYALGSGVSGGRVLAKHLTKPSVQQKLLTNPTWLQSKLNTPWVRGQYKQYPLSLINQADGPYCFTAGTPLLTPTGSQSVETLRPGDLVLSRSEFDPDGPIEAKEVEEVFVRVGLVWTLRVGGREIRTTGEHPFYVLGKGWVNAAFLEVGDQLVSHDGQVTTVDGIDETRKVETVYNLRVADHHTYFVGSPAWGFSVWAHNANYRIELDVATGRYRLVDRAGNPVLHPYTRDPITGTSPENVRAIVETGIERGETLPAVGDILLVRQRSLSQFKPKQRVRIEEKLEDIAAVRSGHSPTGPWTPKDGTPWSNREGLPASTNGYLEYHVYGADGRPSGSRIVVNQDNGRAYYSQHYSDDGSGFTEILDSPTLLP